MGLFDFVKDAGRKLSGGDDGAKDAAVAEYIEENQKANALWHMVTDMGLKVDDLQITFDDGVAKVTGTAESRETAEKVVLAIGNTEGVARVDDRLAYHNPQPPSVFYTVESGDSLSKIALEQYGNASKYPLIFEANKPMLTDPDLIYPGQVLRIPPLDD
ncbi:MAG: peptidoglycan-binding protein LysM [Gemmatimonadota bacterium]|nr:peptidoglycan-binding protein LysM [Gemmatimonadota bacterium]